MNDKPWSLCNATSIVPHTDTDNILDSLIRMLTTPLRLDASLTKLVVLFSIALIIIGFIYMSIENRNRKQKSYSATVP